MQGVTMDPGLGLPPSSATFFEVPMLSATPGSGLFRVLRDSAWQWTDEVSPTGIGPQPRDWASLDDALSFIAHLDEDDRQRFASHLSQRFLTSESGLLAPLAVAKGLVQPTLPYLPPPLAATETSQQLWVAHVRQRRVLACEYCMQHDDLAHRDIAPANPAFFQTTRALANGIYGAARETRPLLIFLFDGNVSPAAYNYFEHLVGTAQVPGLRVYIDPRREDVLPTVSNPERYAVATPTYLLRGKPDWWTRFVTRHIPQTPPPPIEAPSTDQPADPPDESWDTRLRRLRDAQAKARAAADLATDELDRAIAVAHSEGHTQAEIADALGVSQPLVHRLIRRGKSTDLAGPLALARRYRAGWIDRDRLLNILEKVDYRVSTDTSTLGYSDPPDQGAWGEVIQAHRAGYLTDDDYSELAARVFGSVTVEGRT